MSMFIGIFRHELPTKLGRFTIGAHGFKPLSLQMEEGVPVIYEIGVTSPEDYRPYPHHFIWVQTGEQLLPGANTGSFVGTVQFPDGRVLHLFQEWK